MTEREKVLSKIRKLLSLSRSPMQAEAEEAARKARDLLLKYNLSIHDVPEETQDIQEQQYSCGYYSKKWRSILLTNIAKVNFCAMVLRCHTGGYYRYILVGKEHNIQTARWMSDYLLNAVVQISRKKLNRKQRYRETFRYGMAVGISQNLRDLIRQDEVDPELRALAVAEGSLVSEYLNKLSVIKESVRVGSRSKAFTNGFYAGLNVSINTQIGNDSQKAVDC